MKKPKAEWLKVMAAKLDSEEGRALYRLRQQTVEPVFGIIKAALGFTGFSLRGLRRRVGLGRAGLQLQAPAQVQAGDGRVTALLARQAVQKPGHSPEASEIRRPIAPSEQILAVSPNFDRASDRRQRNHSTPKSNAQVRHTASVDLRAS